MVVCESENLPYNIVVWLPNSVSNSWATAQSCFVPTEFTAATSEQVFSCQEAVC